MSRLTRGRDISHAVTWEEAEAGRGQVKRLTDQAYANAKRLLVREEARLHALSKELLDKSAPIPAALFH